MKTITRLLCIPILFILYCILSAHEFWLEPGKFLFEQGEQIQVRFRVGENFEGVNWKGNREKVQSLYLFYGGVKDDLSQLVGNSEGDSLVFSMLDAGTNLVVFNSTNSFIELDSSRFTDYLKEDGLLNALEYRQKNNETDSSGREYYQRCSKTLFQVGNRKDDTYSVSTGLTVDIIPSSNPYSLNNEDSLRVKIFFRDSLLSNTLVKIWHKQGHETIMTELNTDENGEVVFKVNQSGTWMVSTVIMERIMNDPKAQWQSYWGSLTWGYE